MTDHFVPSDRSPTAPVETPPRRPATGLSFLQICNMCVGLFGVQIVWGLHNVNTSHIFQTFGAEIDELAFLWIAAPAAGLLVQPLVGYLSDRTWGPLGRRRPYILGGAVLSAAALLVMPNVTTLWAASAMLWLLIAAINIVMEPFRVLVADSLPEEQHTLGYALQVFFIGAGAVFASALPWMLFHWLDLDIRAPSGELPPAVRIAFYVGAAALLISVAWTVFTTREQPPERFARQPDMTAADRPEASPGAYHAWSRRGWAWLGMGLAIALLAAFWFHSRELQVLAAIAAGYGLLVLMVARRRTRGGALPGALQIAEDMLRMPRVLRHLGAVQFFTWFGLFAMWIFTVPAVAARHFGTQAPETAGYALASNQVSLMFAQYNGVAAVAALLLPLLAARVGRRFGYCLCLLVGAAGLAGVVWIDATERLWLAALGIGIAWAAILSLPYAILADALPPDKRGVYMGIHNIFLVLPQLVAASVLGVVVQQLLDGRAAMALMLAAASFVIAGLCALTIPQPERDCAR